jgi:hypothetical protein
MPQPESQPAAARVDDAAASHDWLAGLRIDAATGRLLDSPSAEEDKSYWKFVRREDTGTKIWRHAPYASWMLDFVNLHFEWVPPDAWRPLRLFAQACALTGGLAVDEFVEPPAASFDANAVARCDLTALARLVAFHAADPSPFNAALWAAEFSARRGAYERLSGQAAQWVCRDRKHRVDPAWHLAHFVHHHPHAFEAALLQQRAEQAQRLRAILPDPFGGPTPQTRGEVFIETGTNRVYCVTCAGGLEGMSPAIIFDARWYACAACSSRLVRPPERP